MADVQPVKPILLPLEVVSLYNNNFHRFTPQGNFTGPDSQPLGGATWQISSQQNFSTLLLNRSLDNRSQLLIPLGVLMPGNSYWIRTQQRTQKGLLSVWSDSMQFNAATALYDQDSNGTDDRYQVDGFMDVDSNGINDRDEGICHLRDATGNRTVGFRSSTGQIQCHSAYSQVDLNISNSRNFSFGLFSFTITGLPVDIAAPASVQATLYFPQALPAGTTWNKYDEADELLSDYSNQAVFNGTTVTLTLVDGGAGDADGEVNGIIIDPGGPEPAAGLPEELTSLPQSDSGGGGGALGAFVLLWLLFITLLRRNVAGLDHRTTSLVIRMAFSRVCSSRSSNDT